MKFPSACWTGGFAIGLLILHLRRRRRDRSRRQRDVGVSHQSQETGMLANHVVIEHTMAGVHITTNWAGEWHRGLLEGSLVGISGLGERGAGNNLKPRTCL